LPFYCTQPKIFLVPPKASKINVRRRARFSEALELLRV
jgi:hypothetical protein